MKEVYLVQKIDGESMIFRYGSSLCRVLKWNKGTFSQGMKKGYYQRDGYSVVKLPIQG